MGREGISDRRTSPGQEQTCVRMKQGWNPLLDHISSSHDLKCHLCGNAPRVSVEDRSSQCRLAHPAASLPPCAGLRAPAAQQTARRGRHCERLLLSARFPCTGADDPSIEFCRHINAFSSILMTKSVTKSFPFPIQHNEICRGLLPPCLRASTRSGLNSAHGFLRRSASLCSTFPTSF